MEKIIVRKCTEQDNLDEIIDVIRDSFLGIQNKFNIIEDLSEREICKEVVEENKERCFIAKDEEKNKIVGTNFYVEEGL